MTRDLDVQKAYAEFMENIPEYLAFLKTAVKTQKKRAAKEK